MDGKSLTPQELKLQQLKEILPEAFAEGKVDWEKLKATLGEDINFANERYVLNWAGKSEAFKVLQAPTTKTLVPDKDESVNFDETENIFIEGENLEVLKVLQKSYFGKVKMIYIDPPYNTGNDSFIYPDKFSETKAEYEKRVGDKDEEGYLTKDGMFRKNSKENGQYHSNWLNMMYPRLFLAKNLLKQDGVIFISIDDNEIHNLRMMMNEVFGEENVEQYVWDVREDGTMPKTAKNTVRKEHEYILAGFKNNEAMSLNKYSSFKYADKDDWGNPDNDPRGPWMSANMSRGSGKGSGGSKSFVITNPEGINYDRDWSITEEEYYDLLKDNRIYFANNGKGVPRRKIFQNEKVDSIQSSIFEQLKSSQFGRNEINDLIKNVDFSYPKPTHLIERIIQIGSNPNDIILDFFAGSGTTAHSVLLQNIASERKNKYICVQMSEECDENSKIFKAGYKTIADIAKERICRASENLQTEIKEKIKTKEIDIDLLKGQLDIDDKEEKINNLKTEIEKLKNQDLGLKILKLSDSNFKQWQQIKGNDAEALENQVKLFVDPVSENATTENMVYELLLKSGKDLNSKLEHKENYYCVNDNELIFMLEKATQEIVDAVIKEKPQKVVALDRLFKGNDQLKTNTSLQMKDVEIEFKTI